MAKLRKDEKQDLQAPPSRLLEHPLFNGSTTVGMVSGENPKFQGQAVGHEALGQALKTMGLKAEERQGRYGAPERSWMVYGPTRDQMYSLGKHFGQESVVYSQGGKHELLYTNGPNAGKFHPALDHEWFQEPPEDYYTHMPELGGHLRLNFDWDTLHPTNLAQPAAVDALNTRAGVASPAQSQQAPDQPVTKAEIRAALARSLRKALEAATMPQVQCRPHPCAYEWHNDHTDHHLHVASPGAVLRSASGHALNKAMPAHPHMDGSKPPEAGTAHLQSPPKNDQAAGVGVSTYGKFAMPYGTVDKANPTDLYHYPYQGHAQAINQLVKDHGYNVYYAGGKYGRPDLANRNYNTKHLMIYDPSPGSGGDFGTEEYTDNWRKIHELSHALTYPDLNQIYGEGRRIGKLGNHRTLREAMRAVHWEWLAAHKQRELSEKLGIHVPDPVFHKELNTVMHDAIHRAVTGKFTEPSGEGYRPHEHKVPLEHALGMVREAAHNLGLTGMHDLIKKSESEGSAMADEKQYSWNEARQMLAKAVKDRVDAYSKELLELRQRELKKHAVDGDPLAHEPAPEMKPMDLCPLCGKEDKPGSCTCLGMAKGEDLAGLADGGAGAGAAPMAQSEMAKAEMCKSCGQPDHDGDCDADMKKAYHSSFMMHGSSKDKKPAAPAQPKPAEEKLGKEELKTKPEEPVKAQEGSGGKITKLKKTVFGMNHPPRAAGAAAPKLPGAGAAPAPKKTFGLADLGAAKQKMVAAGVKPASKLGLPGAKPPTPAAGTAALKGPPAPGAAPAPKAPAPMAAGGGAPKAPAAGGAGPKPAAAAAPKAAAPAQPKSMGKASIEINDLKKNLGNCLLCGKNEHAGQCQ